MTRWLVLGATGTVGRRLTSVLAERPGTSVVAVSRNRVLLEELDERLGCQVVEFDVASPAARVDDLPAADVVVDLTYAGARHPRAVVRKSERAIGLINAYLERHATARLAHTGTFVVLDAGVAEPDRLATRLDWTSTYTLSKSAAERALAHSWKPGRMKVVRLGNVVTPDSMWGIALLRTLRAGEIADSAALASPANACGMEAVLKAVDDPDGAPVGLASAAADWTWGELLAATAGAIASRGGVVCGDWKPSSAREEPRARSTGGGKQSLALRALWPLPLRLDTVGLDAIPGWGRLGPVLKRGLGSGEAPPIMRMPPGLPVAGAMPGASRDAADLEALAELLAGAYMERGYFARPRTR